MRFRNSRLRTKITALLLSLVALWAFAAWVTLREGVNLLWVSVINTGVAEPLDALQPELQMERRLSLIRISDPRPQQRTALQEQRARTDQAIAKFERLARGGNVKFAQSPALKRAIDAGIARFNGLATSRAAIDSGLIDRSAAATAYDGAVDAIFDINDSLATLDDKDFARDVRTLVELNRAREVLSQEDAALSGMLATKRFTTADYVQLVQLIGARRHAFAEVLTKLGSADRTSYDLAANGADVRAFETTEQTLLTKAKAGRRLPITAAQWRATADPALAQLSKAVFGGGSRLVKRAQPIAIGVVARLALAGGLGLAAVIASIVVSITTTRALLRQLEKLRNAARELADTRLPSVVERLGHGENVDVAAEAPPLSFGTDEIGQVGRAFNSVQETAIRTAVEQAELRRGFRDILLSLARRSQALVHRQLTLLDEMERRRDDPKDLEELFRVDHLATRMRRNAENLIVLSGATPARGWRYPVPMIDVVRSAVAEVEDYTRVTVASTIGDVSLAGRSVGDIVHLLAELIENALSYSPPYTQVEVSGRRVAKGYVVEVEDHGLGMTDELLASLNDRISDPPEFNLSSSVHLGLYVVGRLAERYDVRVSLKHSSYGGTTAVVLIPRELISETAPDDTAPKRGARAVAESRPAAIGAAPAATTTAVATATPPDPFPDESHGSHDEHSTGPADEPQEKTPEGFPRRRRKSPIRRPGGTPAGRTVAPVTAFPSPPRDIPDTTPDDEPGETAPSAEGSLTPSGLPIRVPQASIAAPLRTDGPPATAEDEDRNAGGGRSPENVRRSLSGLQAGTRRGRADAAKSHPESRTETAPTADDEA
ncbi:nitrate- and nitrite sensing domain-containing protein [Actinoallomurus rhizosphaericola]|uniref:nitrate- and nitrite sensing domain-containing protein n=1 Tax=Actinoallomurus rhizosphaericola TaxID=2952536 RepID=UPI002092E340|nr:nitrate- and nitrite sensing domain-containing protein [Actinoallomurus rhizosphaericola]MCO5998307.1 nitrate- and nitrite sensing domain-containing protein [Actinoallomurus rhizosphaericola]